MARGEAHPSTRRTSAPPLLVRPVDGGVDDVYSMALMGRDQISQCESAVHAFLWCDPIPGGWPRTRTGSGGACD